MCREGSTSFPSGPRIMNELMKQGEIESSTFSVYLSGHNGPSFIDLGGWDTSRIKLGTEIAWIDMAKNFYWMSD